MPQGGYELACTPETRMGSTMRARSFSVCCGRTRRLRKQARSDIEPPERLREP
jgi:hypothetical protein